MTSWHSAFVVVALLLAPFRLLFCLLSQVGAFLLFVSLITKFYDYAATSSPLFCQFDLELTRQLEQTMPCVTKATLTGITLKNGVVS